MTGPICQRAPGRWQLRVYEGSDPITGKDRYATVAFEDTTRQAQTALAGPVAEVGAGVVAPSAKTGPHVAAYGDAPRSSTSRSPVLSARRPTTLQSRIRRRPMLRLVNPGRLPVASKG